MKPAKPTIIRDLGDGLVLRQAARRDTTALVAFFEHAFKHPDTGKLDEYLGSWVRDLMSGKHPTFQPGDFIIVEDTRANKIVSSTCLISQSWTYDGVPFGVGRIELVATDPQYRRGGLIREQFRVLHEWSVARGELIQAITGIPYYYRQFGYEYAILLVPGARSYVPQNIPELKKGEREPYRVRRATRQDLPFVARMYERAQARSLVNCLRNNSMFEYEQFVERTTSFGHLWIWSVIESRQGERVGALGSRGVMIEGRSTCFLYELLPGATWSEVTPSVMRALVAGAPKLESPDQKPLSQLVWYLFETHPVFEWFGGRTTAGSDPYAWYIRVPDVPAFLNCIAPALERRLAASHLATYTGGLKLNFFRSGVELIFERGKLTTARPWQATAGDFGQKGFGNASFPDLTFLKLLFGYRSRAELQAMFPDCVVDNETSQVMLDILFPKQPTHILPIH